MREKKNVRIKNDGSRIFRLPVKKISGFLGSVMFSVMSGISAAYICRENVAG